MKISPKKSVNFKIRLTDEEYEFLCDMAQKFDLSVAKYLRQVINSLRGYVYANKQIDKHD